MGAWVSGSVGGVVLIKFPGGFRGLETVRPSVIVFMFFLLISGPRFLCHFIDFGTTSGINFRAFWHHFYILFLMSVLCCFFIDFWNEFCMVF